MTKDSNSLFLSTTLYDNGTASHPDIYEVTPDNNEIFHVDKNNKYDINNLNIDSATVIILKKSLKHNNKVWQIHFLNLHPIKVDDVLLAAAQTKNLAVGMRITIYNQIFLVHALPNVNDETEPPSESTLSFNNTKPLGLPVEKSVADAKQAHYLDLIMTPAAQLVAAEDSQESTLNSAPIDILKKLETEFHKSIIDPNFLANKGLHTQDQLVAKNHEQEDYFQRGYALQQASTQSLIDGDLSMSDVDALLGHDHDGSLFEAPPAEDILLLFAPAGTHSSKPLPNLSKQDFYSVGLNSPLNSLSFHTDKTKAN